MIVFFILVYRFYWLAYEKVWRSITFCLLTINGWRSLWTGEATFRVYKSVSVHLHRIWTTRIRNERLMTQTWINHTYVVSSYQFWTLSGAFISHWWPISMTSTSPFSHLIKLVPFYLYLIRTFWLTLCASSNGVTLCYWASHWRSSHFSFAYAPHTLTRLSIITPFATNAIQWTSSKYGFDDRRLAIECM